MFCYFIISKFREKADNDYATTDFKADNVIMTRNSCNAKNILSISGDKKAEKRERE
jgi:hypothetical protein